MNDFILMLGLMCGGTDYSCKFELIDIESKGRYDKTALVITQGERSMLIKTTIQCCDHEIISLEASND